MDVTAFITWILLQLSPILPSEAYQPMASDASSMSADYDAVGDEAGDPADGERAARDNTDGESSSFSSLLVLLVSNGI